MADDKKPTQKHDHGLFERLFGEPWELSDEDLEIALSPTPPFEDALDKIYETANRVAVKYREQGLPIPDHLDSALRASRPFARLDDADPAYLLKIIEKLKSPFLGPVADVAHAYRTVSGISKQDQQILDELLTDLGRDWHDEAQ